jgi:DNA adenine methylase
MSREVASPIRWFGGKSRLDLRNWILPILESIQHEKYVEVFGGGGGLLLAKRRTKFDVYNDIDRTLFDFFTVLSEKDLFERFVRRVSVLPYSKDLFDHCMEFWETEEDKVERVSMWFVVVRQVFSGLIGGGGWSRGRKSMKAWFSVLDRLPEVHDRLQGVFLENVDFRKILDVYDEPKTLFYIDPTYVQSTRKGGGYLHEMTDEDHEDLVKSLLTLEGRVVLSGFENEIYCPLEEAGWQVKKKEVACCASSANEKGLRTEMLWIKPYKDIQRTFFN